MLVSREWCASQEERVLGLSLLDSFFALQRATQLSLSKNSTHTHTHTHTHTLSGQGRVGRVGIGANKLCGRWTCE